jgi:hypothetical protein
MGNLEVDDTIHWTQQELTGIRRVKWVKKESGYEIICASLQIG